MATQSAGLRDFGRRRKNNEDFFVTFEPSDPVELKASGSLYIVADGVGGAAKGERASQFAAEKVLYEYYQPSTLEPLDRLRAIMEHVNAEIFSYADQNHSRMATTMVAAVVRGGYLHVANVGDSRAYLIRDGNVTQINRDHSIVGELVEHGELTEAEAMVSRIKNRLTRSLGGDPDVTVDVYSSIQLKPGDKILLCSDGLTRYALREDIARMTAAGTPEEIIQRLIGFANQKGGADNISVVAVAYQGGEVLEPTVVIPRPQRVDMDTYVTQPEVVKRKSRRYASTSAIVIMLIIGIVSVGLLMAIAFGAISTSTAAATNTVVSMLGGYQFTSPQTIPPQGESASPVIPIEQQTSIPTEGQTSIPTEGQVSLTPATLTAGQTPSPPVIPPGGATASWIEICKTMICGRATDGINIRSSPEKRENNIIEGINNDEQFIINGINKEGLWFKVTYTTPEGKMIIGWVYSSFVELLDPMQKSNIKIIE